MKKRLLALLLSLTLVATMFTGCGGSGSASNKEEKLETWEDDYVFSFNNEKMHEKIQKLTGITSRDITYADVKGITEIEWYGNSDALKYFTGLKKLELRSAPDDFESLKYLTNLKELTLDYCDMEELTIPSTLKKLQSLIIVNAENLETINMAKLDKLGYLIIGKGTKIKDIKSFENLSNLKELSISGKIKNLDAIKNNTGLNKLEIYNCKIEDFSVLSNLKELKEINIYTSKLTDFSTLSSCPNLETLCLSKTEMTTLDLNCKNLKELRISNCAELVDIKGLKGDSLESLEINYCKKLKDLSPIGKLESLTELTIDDIDGLKNLNEIKGANKLEILHLSNCDDLEDLSAILELNNLKTLDITNLRGLKNIEVISNHNTLEVLIICIRNDIEDVYAFAKMPNLKFIKVEANNCNINSIEELRQYED